MKKHKCKSTKERSLWDVTPKGEFRAISLCMFELNLFGTVSALGELPSGEE